MKRILLPLLILCLLTGCTIKEKKITIEETPSAVETEDKMQINLVTDNKNFQVDIQNSPTVNYLLENLPIDTRFSELNGNEYYSSLDLTFPVDSKAVGAVEAGDVMLYQDNTLVIFYKSFITPYSYTPIGHIENVDELVAAIKNDPDVLIKE